MTHTNKAPQKQADIRVLGKIDGFFKQYKVASILHQCGIRKHRGHSVTSLIRTIFTLPFLGKNFFRGIVINDELPFGKDAAYEVLKRPKSNWRRLVLHLAVQLYGFFNRLTNEDRESVLIVDDSTYDRSRSKAVELLARVWDHSNGRFIRGFRMLTFCWSDGASCLPLDFALLSSTDVKQRFCESAKTVDKRCCSWQRRKEATLKATEHLETMLTRILSAGIQAKYLLMDSWFTMPSTVTALSKHIHIIGMVKKSPKVLYDVDGQRMHLMAIYRNLKKRRGRAKTLAGTVVRLKGGLPVKLIFVRDRRKKDWLPLISTDLNLAGDEIIRIYGKRWDIEVFFKMSKQHLRLTKEIQCRDFDALIAHTSIVFMRYMFLAYQHRIETDSRTFGELFYACCDELADISFMESLYRILNLAGERIKRMGSLCERTIIAIFNTVMQAALQCVGLSKSKVLLLQLNPES